MYDYYLSGKDNYAADRAAAEATIKVNPGLVPSAHANRAFLGRVIRYLAAEARQGQCRPTVPGRTAHPDLRRPTTQRDPHQPRSQAHVAIDKRISHYAALFAAVSD